MKNRSVGKLFVLSSLAVVALFSCNKDKNTVAETAPYKNQTYDAYKYVGKTVPPLRIGSMNLSFYNIENLPYVSVIDYLNSFIGNGFYSVTHKNDVFTFTNNWWKQKSSSYKPNAYFDMKTQTLKYDDYTCFININYEAANPLDLISGEDKLYNGKKMLSLQSQEYKAGSEVSINLKSTYNIDSYVYKDKLYMPLYTVKTLFTSNYIESVFFNGNALYQQVPNESKYSKYVDEVKKGIFNPTSNYLEYNYNQTVLELDLRFGMGGITRNRRDSGSTTFNVGLNNSCYSWFKNNKSALTSSPSSFDTTIEKIYASNLDDGGHTGLLSYSYYHDYPEEGHGYTRGDEFNYIYQGKKNITDNISVSGDSTFLKKSDNNKALIYRMGAFDDDANLDNFVNLVKFQNENNDYKHIVIDLSRNGGGYIYLQHFISQFLARGKLKNYFTCSVNGSKGCVSYKANTNADESFDSNDYLLEGSTVDIICSNGTFSAANATACYAKEYESKPESTINICGERTGGGACAVDSTVMTPLGSYHQISCPYRICNKNYNHLDNGVAPTSGSGYEWNSHDTTSSDTGAAKFTSYYKYDDLEDVVVS